jgi:DNA invertase Pin-like site-specific DNA recombinase
VGQISAFAAQFATHSATQFRSTGICHDLSRLSRHTEDLTKLVRDTKAEVHEAISGKQTSGVVVQAIAARAEYDGKQISERTIRALTEKKATGFKLGNPTNLPEAQKIGSEKNAERARNKAEAIADIISRTPDAFEMTASKIANLLNSSGCLSGRGKPWTVSGIRRPLTYAWEIIAARDAQKDMDDPLFGMF